MRTARRLIVARATAVIATTLAFVATSSAAEVAGYVVELEGAWTIDRPGNTPLKRWDDVPAESVIRIAAPAPGNKLRIVDRSGVVVINRICAAAADCATSIPIKGANAGAPTGIARVVDVVMQKLRSAPDRPSSHISRGDDGASSLADAVLSLAADRIDLAAVFAKTPAGAYRVRLQPILRDANEDRSVGPLAIDWVPGRSATIPVNGLRAGLYEIDLMRTVGGRTRAAGAPAWILVASTPRFEAAAASFTEANALAAQWAGQLDASTARIILRTHLEALADETPR